jgi:hypothetical protein
MMIVGFSKSADRPTPGRPRCKSCNSLSAIQNSSILSHLSFRHRKRSYTMPDQLSPSCRGFYSSEKRAVGRSSSRTRCRACGSRRHGERLLDGYSSSRFSRLKCDRGLTLLLRAFNIYSSLDCRDRKAAKRTQFFHTTQRFVFDFYFDPIV